MDVAKNHEKLITRMADLQEDAVLDLVQQQLAEGIGPLDIVENCQKGMIKVGERYEQGQYYISGLIMAGEIMRKVGQLVFPLLEGKIMNGNSGSIVLGTVEGDIHYIGKDIFKTLARVHGFTVHDLGVDVPPSKFLAAIHEFKPHIVGLSCLISAAFKSMRETITFLKQNVSEKLLPRACIIGGQVDELVCKEVQSDYWTKDAMKGVLLCQKIMAGS
jgi:methanogenic corrinoid protein MtbC1